MKNRVVRVLSTVLCIAFLLALVPTAAFSATKSPFTVTFTKPESLEYKELDTIEFTCSIVGPSEENYGYFSNHAFYIGRDLKHMTNNGPSVEEIGFDSISQSDEEIKNGSKATIRAQLRQSNMTEPYDAYIVLYYEIDGLGYYAYSSYKLKITPDGWQPPQIKGSKWALPELEKAGEYGLITEKIREDLTAPISREEFAELAVRLYEVYTGKKAAAVSPNPFNDTDNEEILKAYKLGIVNGVGQGKYDPSSLTNREQIAAMLNRAVKVIAPKANLSTAGAPVFTDAKSIASYFTENVKFMSKNGFIKGSNGKFEPKGTCTREQAVLIAVRLYEFYQK